MKQPPKNFTDRYMSSHPENLGIIEVDDSYVKVYREKYNILNITPVENVVSVDYIAAILKLYPTGRIIRDSTYYYLSRPCK